MRRLILLLLITASFTSCKLYQEVKVSDVQNVVLGEVTTDGIEAQIYFEVENPNWYNMMLKESKIEIFIEGKYFGVIDQFEEISIPKKSKTTQALRMKTGPNAMDDLLANALKLFLKSDLKLEAKGYVIGKAMLMRKRIDISVTEQVSKEQFGL